MESYPNKKTMPSRKARKSARNNIFWKNKTEKRKADRARRSLNKS